LGYGSHDVSESGTETGNDHGSRAQSLGEPVAGELEETANREVKPFSTKFSIYDKENSPPKRYKSLFGFILPLDNNVT
jgi:hypothetical protein